MRLESVPRGTSYLERRAMALSLCALFSAGGFLTGLSVLLPHPKAVIEEGALLNAGLALLASLIVFLWGSRLPVAGFHIAAALGSALISTGIHFGGYAPSSPSYGLFYLWVVVYCFSFFTFTQAMIQSGVAAASHLIVLGIDGRVDTLITDWILTWGILFVTGVVVGWLSGQVRTLAETDTLTGLRNRRAWETELERELANASRTQQPISVILIDVDGLKSTNDTHGHQAGDRLLKEAAAAWSGAIRAGDLIARIGGDEFAVLLSGCSLEGAAKSLTRLDGSTSVPFCAGIAQWDGTESPDDLMHRADVALYGEKKLRYSTSSRVESTS